MCHDLYAGGSTAPPPPLLYHRYQWLSPPGSPAIPVGPDQSRCVYNAGRGLIVSLSSFFSLEKPQAQGRLLCVVLIVLGKEQYDEYVAAAYSSKAACLGLCGARCSSLTPVFSDSLIGALSLNSC